MELPELQKELQTLELKRRELKNQIAATKSEFIFVRYREKRTDKTFNSEGWYNPNTGKLKDGTVVASEDVWSA